MRYLVAIPDDRDGPALLPLVLHIFVAVEDPAVAVAAGGRASSPRDSLPGVRLGQPEAADHLAGPSASISAPSARGAERGSRTIAASLCTGPCCAARVACLELEAGEGRTGGARAGAAVPSRWHAEPAELAYSAAFSAGRPPASSSVGDDRQESAGLNPSRARRSDRRSSEGVLARPP